MAHLARGAAYRWLRVAAPITVAVVVGLVLVSDRGPVDPATHRAPPALVPPGPVAIAPAGLSSSVQVLRWHAVVGADRYRVTLFDGEGEVLWEAALADTLIGLPGDVALEPGRPYYWIVSARTGFDRWDTSALIEFSVSSATDPR
jgi:hypothetical protein